MNTKPTLRLKAFAIIIGAIGAILFIAVLTGVAVNI